MFLEDIKKRFSQVKDRVSFLDGERNLLKEQLNDTLQLIHTEKEDISIYNDARKLLELFVKSTEYNIRQYLEPIITEALEFVFSQYLKFHLVFFTRRNQVEVDFAIFRSPDLEEKYQEYIKLDKQDALLTLIKDVKNINYMYGGAINQVVATILRIIIAESLKLKGPIILDEPSSAVSEEYNIRLGHLLVSLSKRFDRQYVLITHSDALASCANLSYRVTKENSISKVSLLDNKE